jgi:flagellar M-ring protein FliF
VAVLDMHGNLLTRGFAENGLAEQTDHNLTLQNSVEEKLERKVLDIFEGLLGPGKARVKAAAELDFNQVQKTVESYDPNTKVIRSQQRDDGMVRGSPNAQLEQKEGSITNYEFDKTVARIVESPGAVTRVTLSVAVDGTYKTGAEGKREYAPRSQEELDKFSALVKNAVGYRPDSKDEVFVTNVQFDREQYHEEQEAFQKLERREWIQVWQKYGVILLIALFGLWFLRGLVQNLSSAMNPPRPRYAGLNLESLEEKVPGHVQKQKDILEKVEIMTHTEPVNIANLIKTWLHEESTGENREGKNSRKAAGRR